MKTLNPKADQERARANHEKKLAIRKPYIEFLINKAKQFVKIHKLDQKKGLYNKLLYGDPNYVFQNGIYASLIYDFFNKLFEFNNSLVQGFSRFEMSLDEDKYPFANKGELGKLQYEKLLLNAFTEIFGNKFKAATIVPVRYSRRKDKLLNTLYMEVRTKSGDKTILLTKYPFGEISRYFVTSILKNEPETLLFMGNSGAVLPTTDWGVKVNKGDLIVPVKIYDQFGNLVNPTVKNEITGVITGLIGKLTGLSIKRRGDLYFGKNSIHFTKHIKVASPLFETEEVLDSWMEDRFGTVDVEVAEILYTMELYKTDFKLPRLGILLHVSDIPIEESLDAANVRSVEVFGKAKEKTVDYFVKFLQIEDVL